MAFSSYGIMWLPMLYLIFFLVPWMARDISFFMTVWRLFKACLHALVRSSMASVWNATALPVARLLVRLQGIILARLEKSQHAQHLCSLHGPCPSQALTHRRCMDGLSTWRKASQSRRSDTQLTRFPIMTHSSPKQLLPATSSVYSQLST